MQEKAYHAIQEIYEGAVPDPHEFDRVEYIKALHTVKEIVLNAVFVGSDCVIGGFPILHSRPTGFCAGDLFRIDI